MCFITELLPFPSVSALLLSRHTSPDSLTLSLDWNLLHVTHRSSELSIEINIDNDVAASAAELMAG